LGDSFFYVGKSQATGRKSQAASFRSQGSDLARDGDDESVNSFAKQFIFVLERLENFFIPKGLGFI
jgi:hypothetical protein